jgi:hypothetical protein
VPDTTEDPTPRACNTFSNVTGGARPITIANQPTATLQFPSGVAYTLAAHQMIRIEAHYLSASASNAVLSAGVKFVPGADMSYQQADFMFCGTLSNLLCPDGGLAPGIASLDLPADYYGGGPTVDMSDLTLFAITSHQHHLGTGVKIWKSAGAGDPSPLLVYSNPDWRDAPLVTFDPAHSVTFAAGEGLRWQCSYDTSTKSEKTCFGEETENDEMCLVMGYYYPSRGLSDGRCFR